MLRKILLGAALAVCSFATFANSAVYLGTVTTPTGFANYQENIQGARVYAAVASAQQQVMATIKSTISSQLMPIITTTPGYQAGSGMVVANGPVTISLNNGVATLSGLTVNASLTVAQYGVSCLVQVGTNPGMSLSGAVDPVAGTFTVTGVQNFSLSTSYNCSTIVDWVPIVNILTQSLVSHLADQIIAKQVQNAYNSLGQLNELKPVQFAGLNQIPNGVLVYNGVDYGALLKSDLANMFYSAKMTLTIGDPKHLVTSSGGGYASKSYSTDLVLYLNIGGVSFQLLDKREYDNEYYCPPTNKYCIPV